MDREAFSKIKNPTEKQCIEYLMTDTFAIDNMHLIPKKFKESNDFICKVVAKNGWSLDCFEDEFKTQKAYEIAVKETKSQMLGNIPSEYQTPQMCLDGLKVDKSNYRAVQIVDNPDYETTKSNLENLIKINKNKQLVQKTISSISIEGNSL